MIHALQRNFFFIWILVLLGVALVLTLTLTGCSAKTESVPVEGKATNVLSPDSGCADSDNGTNLEIKGIATFNGTSKDDECVGPFLVEYYCDNGKMANQNFKCNCSKGKCVSKS